MKQKFRFTIGQFLNRITGFTTLLESESERRAYEILQKSGYRVKKQYRIAPYRLDFYLPSLRINIEIDGFQHTLRQEQDKRRDKTLLGIGIRTIRIPAHKLYTADSEKYILKKLKDSIR